METAKSVIGVVAVILVFVGYVPYIRDVLAGRTVPHVYSWFLWGFVTAIAFALQFSGNAGIGAFVTLAAASMCSVVFVLGMMGKGKKDITLVDSIFMILALVALVVWVFAKQPVLSAVLTTMIDLLGFAPTVRKSWNKPHTETISFYYLNSLRFALAIVSLQHYSVVTALYPASWLVANGGFALLLWWRRRVVGDIRLA